MSRRCQRLRERLDCFVHGHRDLSPAPAYAEALNGAAERELRYCGACGSPTWVAASHDQHRVQNWAETGLADK